jgi:hypothetical protein
LSNRMQPTQKTFGEFYTKISDLRNLMVSLEEIFA